MCERRFQDNKYVDLIPFILRGRENMFQNEKRKCKTWLIPLFLLTKCGAFPLPKLTVVDPCVHRRGPRFLSRRRLVKILLKNIFQVCGKAFKRPDHFKQHKIIHSESKPFKCDTCQRTFNQKVCLRKHLPCREQEKQQKKLQKSLVNKKTKAGNKGKRQPVSMRSTGKNKSTVNLKTNLKERGDNQTRNEAAKGLNCCNVTNDVNLAFSAETSPSEGSILSRCYSPPSFVRPTPKLIDGEDYSVSSESSFQPERDMGTLLSLPQNMFSCEDDTLSLDSPLPPLSSHVTDGLSGRPPIVDSSTDLGCILLDGSMASENLASIVEEASSLFV